MNRTKLLIVMTSLWKRIVGEKSIGIRSKKSIFDTIDTSHKKGEYCLFIGIICLDDVCETCEILSTVRQ